MWQTLSALAVFAVCAQTTSGAEQRQHVRTSARHADQVEIRRTHEAWEAAALEESAQAGPDLHSAWEGELAHGEEDIFAHVRPLIEHQEAHRDSVQAISLVETGAGTKAAAGVGKVHAFCEICILIMQMKERGQPHLCAGLNPDYFISCVENLESILRSDKAVVYWLRSGCMHLDREGPEIVKPCPAHAICAWVPNLFADVGIISPRNSLAPLCPRDFKYLPRIPRKPATATAL
jgi:hypothetical protein